MKSQKAFLLCGINEENSVDFYRIIFFSAYILIVTSAFLFLVKKLYNGLQMFPIKEKSGKLIFIFVLFNYLFLMSYPLLLLMNLHLDTHSKQILVLRYLYNIYVITYFMRSLRIHYAYSIKQQMQGFIYRTIKNENFCCLLTIFIGAVLYLAPYDIIPYRENIFDDTIEGQAIFQKSGGIQKVCVVAFNQLVLLSSLQLIRKAKSTFNIQTEIMYAIILEFIFISIKQSLAIYGQIEKLNVLCYNQIPLYYVSDSCKTFILVWITAASPLIQVEKVAQHFPYPIVANNFELFLSEPQCIDIFYKYLSYYDKNHKVTNKEKIVQKKNLISPVKISCQQPSTFDSKRTHDSMYDIQQDTLPLDNSRQDTLRQDTFNQDQFRQDTLNFDNLNWNNLYKESLTSKDSPRFKKVVKINENNENNENNKTIILHSLVDRKIQTVECYLLWMDLTIIFFKHNALNQNQPPTNTQMLEDEIILYMKNLFKTVNLQKIMPLKLAEELQKLKIINNLVEQIKTINQLITQLQVHHLVGVALLRLPQKF